MKRVTRIPLLMLCSTLAIAGCDSMRSMMTKTHSATSIVLPTKDSVVKGVVRFTQREERVLVSGRITGLTPGPHGFHIHEKGDCSAPDGSSAGPHFNPSTSRHGGLHDDMRHGGDLGNIIADADGVAEFTIEAAGISIGAEPDSVIGRSVIVHAQPDDMKSQPAGNAGPRLGCGLISRAE